MKTKEQIIQDSFEKINLKIFDIEKVKGEQEIVKEKTKEKENIKNNIKELPPEEKKERYFFSTEIVTEEKGNEEPAKDSIKLNKTKEDRVVDEQIAKEKIYDTKTH